MKKNPREKKYPAAAKIVLNASLVASFISLGFGSSALAARYLVVLKNKEATFQAANFEKLKASGLYDAARIKKTAARKSIHQLSLKSARTLEKINSMVVQLENESDLESLKSSDEVALVEAEVFHPSPKPVAGMKVNRRSLKSSLTQSMRRILDDATAGVAGVGAPWGITAVKAPAAWTLSGKGAGARVGVLDTGIDRDHPSLKGNFEDGADFAGDNKGAYSYFDMEGHGSHVSGTIAGIEDASGFSGVAPQAKLLMGRVCGDRGCSNIAVAEGINWAISKKVDVISMSLGGSFSTPGERTAIYNAEAAGISIVAAAGNDGVDSVSYPAAIESVIAVGAVDSTLSKAVFSQYGPELDIVAPGVEVLSSVPMGSGRVNTVTITVDGNSAVVPSSVFVGSKDFVSPEKNNLVLGGLGAPEELAMANVKGKYVLIRRGGGISFFEKVQNAMANGATGVLIYNTEKGVIHGTLGTNKVNIAVIGLDKDGGEKLASLLTAGKNIVAGIESKKTDYLAFDGTSMATPHVSGVVALMKAANKALTPQQVRDILGKTATPLNPNDKNQLGHGMVNAEEAVKAAIQLK